MLLVSRMEIQISLILDQTQFRKNTDSLQVRIILLKSVRKMELRSITVLILDIHLMDSMNAMRLFITKSGLKSEKKAIKV